MQHFIMITPPEMHTAWGLLSAISDPEVPVLTITDLGAVRGIERCDDGRVTGLTLTYSGYPATKYLLGEIRVVMVNHGYTLIRVVLQLDPPWTTDWMNPDVYERLRQYGISPSQAHTCHAEMPTDVQCLRCASTHTSLISEFNSTACKALHRCGSCRELSDCSKCI